MRAPLQKQKFNRLIADDLRRRILGGEYAAGSLLPTESALALEYGSNRNTLREAVRILETQGLLSARQGEGVRVVDFRQRPTIELIGYMLAEAEPTPEMAEVVLDLLALRKLLAAEIVRHAAGKLTKKTGAEVRKLLRAIASPAVTEAERTTIDRQILERLVQSTGSLVYTALFNSIYGVIADGAAKTAALTTLPPDYAEQMESVMNCLLEDNAAGAAEAMRDLCDASDAVLLQSLQASLMNP